MAWNLLQTLNAKRYGAPGSPSPLANALGAAYSAPRNKQDMVNQSYRDAAAEHAYGNRASNAYLGQAMSFDARKGLNQWATGAASDYNTNLRQTLGDLAGASVGQGRLDTGFYDQDAGNVIRSSSREFANALAAQSMNAQGQQMANTAQLGAFGTNARDTGYDMDYGALDRYDMESTANKQAKAAKPGFGSMLGGALGMGLGSMFGGLGAGLGGALGKKVGGLFGG